ncbi:MAG: M48 family metallopeptidase, partial [Betaproteobacteria bacterium]
MNRRGFLRWGCAHCALLYAASAQAQAVPASGGGEWALPPRFAAPETGSDEGGLWAIMAREETRLRRSPFLIRDDALGSYLQDILCRLAGPHCPDVRVYAVRNPYFNANMAPNGMMQIWSGLLLRMDNEAQLAAVVAHEVGHFVQRHSLERLRDAKAKSAAGVFLAPFGLVGLVGQLALIASMFAYTRDQEREADTISVQLMAIAGYDTSQAAVVWANLL